jgi:pyrroloquinoline quinone (PQQ) biosynthesis protein C
MKPQHFEFFSVHLVSDLSHAGSEMEAINTTCADADAVVGATGLACDRLWQFLDGCYEAIPAGTN